MQDIRMHSHTYGALLVGINAYIETHVFLISCNRTTVTTGQLQQLANSSQQVAARVGHHPWLATPPCTS
jgi:hypothetical protein